VLPGHDKGVTWCKGRVWQREKRNDVVFLDDPSSVTRDEEAAEDAPVITPSHQHTVPDSESKSATMVPGGALPANAAPLPTRPGVMPVMNVRLSAVPRTVSGMSGRAVAQSFHRCVRPPRLAYGAPMTVELAGRVGRRGPPSRVVCPCTVHGLFSHTTVLWRT
jgi:hypothetical protein